MDALSVGSLKRKFEDVDVESPYSTPKDSDDDISSSDSAESCDSLNPPSSTPFIPASILRRQKSLGRKSVRFDAVTVYYFSRRQGFTSVPSQGGSSLGMARHHSAIRRYTLGEFAREQESSHRQVLRQHLREEKLNARKMKLTKNGTVESAEAESLTLEDVSDEDIDVDSVDVDDYFFLQPLPTKRRRALLRASGISRIDGEEKTELRAIRLSREECGCDCRFYCDPQSCGCSQAGIKCQVDRMSFPCGCSRDGCRNAAGRIEFNPVRVRTHYLHTIMKLELEKNRQLATSAAEVTIATTAASSSHASPQTDVAETVTSGVDADELPSSPQSELPQDLGKEYSLQRDGYGTDSFDMENETAVLHLQSAEEFDRRRVEEEGQAGDMSASNGLGVCLLEGPGSPDDTQEVISEAATTETELGAPVIIQGELPPGASVLCFTENLNGSTQVLGEHPQDYLKDTSVLFYQIDQGTVLGFEGGPLDAGLPAGYTKAEGAEGETAVVVHCGSPTVELEGNSSLEMYAPLDSCLSVDMGALPNGSIASDEDHSELLSNTLESPSCCQDLPSKSTHILVGSEEDRAPSPTDI
ncbi:cysteine/serine-rich nuclear protein 2 [Polypterus senegalus]|nr:cysteine/serine-rich nuclear protein 2 [Polypterus senegalus]